MRNIQYAIWNSFHNNIRHSVRYNIGYSVYGKIVLKIWDKADVWSNITMSINDNVSAFPISSQTKKLIFVQIKNQIK